MNPLVEIHNLQVRRGAATILEIARMQIPRSQVTALVGPNGAGKTTLLLALARLLKPSNGQILFDGQALEHIPALDYRRRIGIVMQDALLLDRSVYENVALGLRLRHTPGTETCRRVDEWLERLGIAALRNRRANMISGGEAQRVALARALVLQPSLLLLDEPFKSLDETSHDILLKDLARILPLFETTTVIATHNTKDVQELSGKKIALHCGKLANDPQGLG